MDTKTLEQRETRLQDLSVYLKKEFIGLESQIDKIIDNLKIWYVLPEILDRPIIINLWGMTGTGKTDLVRKIVDFLSFQDNYVEVQMGTEVTIGGGYSSKKATTVRDLLVGSDLKEQEPSIILFDEFQRFRRKGEDGKMLDDKTFDDIWMLLSDGKFSSEIKGSSNEMIENEIEMIEYYIEAHEESQKEEKIKTPLKISRWEKKKYSNIAKKLKYTKPLKNYTDVQDMLENVPDDFNMYAGQEYTKSLIFICGNIDDAYSMSTSMDGDGDADILHNYSKRINVVKIKNCLSDLFKPEQIARLGNNHIIYPCLNKDNYQKLIRRTVDRFLDRLGDTTGLAFSYDEDFVKLIYDNFVFPAQGTRPVFSGINSLISSSYPKVLFKYIRNQMEGGISYEVNNGELFVKFNQTNETEKVEYQFDLDNIRKNVSRDKMVMFSVHETGHALVYSKLFGYAPKQIKVNLTSFDGAYVIPNDVSMNKQYVLDMIKVYLAGTIAEEIVFGDAKRSTGCVSDLREATELAVKYVRLYGFAGKLLRSNNTNSSSGSEILYDDTSLTDKLIEPLIQQATDETKALLNNNRELLKTVSEYVLDKKEVGGEEFANKFGSHFGGLKFIDPLDFVTNDEIVDTYEDKFQVFKIDND